MGSKPTHEERVSREGLIIQRHANEGGLEQELSYRVRKSNKMIQESRFSLSLREQRLLLYLISKIKESDNGGERYKVKISTVARILGVRNSDQKIDEKTYKEVFAAFSTLRDKGFTLYTDRNTIVHCAFIDDPEQDKDGNMEFTFNRFVVPYLFQVKKRFTEYNMDMILPLRSSYGIRLYELLLSYTYSDTYTKDIPIEELRERLGADSKTYSKYALFKEKVLLPALRDLKKTDLRVDYLEIRKERKVISIRFVISKDYMQYWEDKSKNTR